MRTYVIRLYILIDWSWLWGGLIYKGAICTGTAPLFWNSISLFERPRTRWVRKIGSQNQSIEITRIISNIYISRLDFLFFAYFMSNGCVLISCIRFLVCRTAKYTNICIHIYEYMYTHMFVYSIHICINVILIYVYIHTCLNLNICIHIYEYIYTHMFVYRIHMCITVILIYVYVHTCLNLHIHLIHTLITTGSRHCAVLDISGHIYESVTQHIWMSHVSHMQVSCHTSIRHITHMNASDSHLSHVTRICVMSHIWVSYVTHMNQSGHTYECVSSRIRMSHVTRMNKPCHSYECVTSQKRMSHVTHMKELFHMYECVISHTWRSPFSNSDEPCHILSSLLRVYLWHAKVMHYEWQYTVCHKHTHPSTPPPPHTYLH